MIRRPAQPDQPPQKHFSAPLSPGSMEKVCRGYAPSNTSKITSWSVRVLNTWCQERNERSLFAAEDGSVSQHVHSLHHGSPRHDIFIMNSISLLLSIITSLAQFYFLVILDNLFWSSAVPGIVVRQCL